MSAQDTYNPVAAVNAPETDRASFMAKVYLHVGYALAAFLAFEVVLFVTGIAESMREFFLNNGGFTWLLLLGGVMFIQGFAAKAATNLSDPGVQYMGLFGSAFGQALIFAPFLSYVFSTQGGTGTVAQAAIVTLVGFAMLTAIGLFTRKDLSFLRPIVMWGFGLAMIAIVGAVIFEFDLGVWFSVAMIGLAGAAILFQTQSILRKYPIGAHVPAALSLFSSLMTMFWYVLRLFMSRD